MVRTAPATHYSPQPTILERKAGDYLGKLNPRRGEETDVGRPTSPSTTDIARARVVERRAIAFAALTGIISGSLIGAAEVMISRGAFGDLDGASWREQLPVWSAFLAFAGIISAAEIALLYRISLQAIAKVAAITGVHIGDDGYPELATRGLARAALEFPNPRVLAFGIDPYRLIPRWRMAAHNIAYKMKVGVSSFLLRVFLRRVVGRMALRGLVPLIAGPLYAVWNAIITWRILREVRIRIFGPITIERVLNATVAASDRDDDISHPAVEAMLHGVGELMIRGRDSHPNYVYLLSRLRQFHDAQTEDLTVEWAAKQDVLTSLTTEERQTVLDILTLAGLLGSRIHSDQTTLLQDACRIAGFTFSPETMRRLHKDMQNGRAIGRDDLASSRKPTP